MSCFKPEGNVFEKTHHSFKGMIKKMSNTKYGGYISKLAFNNGEQLDITENDIVIFVGPNNAGKSQSLKDIYQLSSKKLPTIVISDIEIKKYDSPISDLLKQVASLQKHGD